MIVAMKCRASILCTHSRELTVFLFMCGETVYQFSLSSCKQ